MTTENGTDRATRIEDRLAKPMFALAVLFLMLLAAAIHLNRESEERFTEALPGRIVLGAMLALWPFFLAEGVTRFFFAPRGRRNWKTLTVLLAVGLFPPLRMAAHSRTRPGRMWLPGMGWRETDFDLSKELERFFSTPMVCMALLILPILAVEYFWADAVEQYAMLRAVLGISLSVIWIAFTVEFVIRCSAAEKKIGYAMEHWVDLAVVLLPALEFMPFLRVLRATRVMRLKTILRMAKYYRLYGLAGKGWQGLVVLDLIQRWFSRSPEARVSRLRGHLETKLEEIREIECEVDYYRRKIAEAEAKLESTEDEPG
ncbi:MAG: hypothetical protein KY475_07890 [Planctomycetes bacterium]|nr:hypothetical protein [Planctomycetota bacterium]